MNVMYPRLSTKFAGYARDQALYFAVSQLDRDEQRNADHEAERGQRQPDVDAKHVAQDIAEIGVGHCARSMPECGAEAA